jgi:hypothetical protein
MTISFNKLNLHLLRVSNVFMEENSVLRASQRVCLSQSAVSHAFARLRECSMMSCSSDPDRNAADGTRTHNGTIDREALRSLKGAIGTPNFKPKQSARRFTIAVSKLVATVIVPRDCAVDCSNFVLSIAHKVDHFLFDPPTMV